MSDTGALDYDSIHPQWRAALEPVKPAFEAVSQFLGRETSAGREYLPAAENVLRVFTQSPSDVRVLILGQDPYPSPGHPIGLAFSVARAVRPIPRSLRNVLSELNDDLGIEPASHGDLSAWALEGVFLLNRVLTVRAGAAGSHRGIGWEAITEHAVRVLAERAQPPVAILWGSDARSLKPVLAGATVIESAHPSPLSASRGFFGSRPFSRANDALAEGGLAPIDWRVDSPLPETSH
ncbi:MAG: uracil-DNA glycosylase [Microbacteriaceae bacterium]